MDSQYLFDSLTKSSFLYYSWLEILYLDKFNSVNKCRFPSLKPISLRWFRKASYSLKIGSFLYSRHKVRLIKDKNLALYSFRIQILENAIYNLVYHIIIILRSLFLFLVCVFKFNLLIFILLTFILPLVNIIKKATCFVNNVNLMHANFLVIKNVWRTKRFFIIRASFNYVETITYSLEIVKFWNPNLDFFIKFNVYKSFNLINLNRLKNIFSVLILDFRIWIEIKKILVFRSVNFNEKIFNLNILANFLFNIYISEFDNYLFNLFSFFNSKYYKYKNFFYTINNSSVYSSLVPLKITSGSFYYPFLTRNTLFLFNQGIYITRFSNYFFLGILGSTLFKTKLKNKIIGFLRGLCLILESFYFFSSFEKNIIFFGYRLFITGSTSNSFNFLKEKKFRKLILLRFSYKSISYSKLFLNRFYHEFFERVNNLIYLNFYKFFIFRFKKILVLSFIFESVSFFSSNNLTFSLTLPLNTILPTFNFSLKYFFNYFIFQLKKILIQHYENYSTFGIYLFFPMDLAFSFLIKDFNMNLSFFYFILFDLLEVRNTYLRSYFTGKTIVYSGFLFSYSDVNTLLYFYSSVRTLYRKRFFSLLIPVNSLISNFRSIGIFHFYANRSIGNIYFMFLDDNQIILNFKILTYLLYIWYKKASNSYKLRFFSSLLKNSCCLTLSRKHNKSKSWSLRVYKVVLSDCFNNVFFLNANSFSFDNDFFLKL
uniref:Maturase-like protein n=1 Tax=Lepocinclis spirogyroides TaxID=298306 RepID=O98717_9EUGL|nr:maturase-like protein [Lepocinclis spirogyroides]